MLKGTSLVLYIAVVRHPAHFSFLRDAGRQQTCYSISLPPPYIASEIPMDFSCFQPHAGICGYMPFDSYMQQNGRYELHPVDHHPFEVIGDYTSATFNDLGHQFFAERENKKPMFDHVSSVGYRVGAQVPLLTPKTEVSNLMNGGLGSYKAYEMNGRFLPRKKTSLKKVNVVKGQWTIAEDR